MKLIAHIEGDKFPVSVGNGNRDLAWLAQMVAHIYGRKLHPTYNYMPILLKLPSGEIPHPRWRINQIFHQENEEFRVYIRKPNTIMDETYNLWYEQAFGTKRYRMKCRWTYTFEKKKVGENAKDIKITGFVVVIDHQKFPEAKADPSYKGKDEIPMEIKYEDNDVIELFLEKEFPFGEMKKYSLLMYYTNKDEATSKSPKDLTNDPNFQYYCEPEPIAEAQMVRAEIEEIERQPGSPDTKPEEEPQEMEGPWGRCPYTIDSLWKSLDWTWLNENYQNRIRKFLIIEMDKLYEIFYHYSQFHKQLAQHRDQIAITWQDLQLILKFYEVTPNTKLLIDFSTQYNEEHSKIESYKDTLSLNHPIYFPEFIFILLKAIKFTEEQEEEQKENEAVFENGLSKMISIHANDEAMTDFQRYMLFSTSLIELLREKSKLLKDIFLRKLKDALQIKAQKYYFLKTEINSLIRDIYQGDNIDEAVDMCFAECTPGEKYHNFEGLYYYEYLQALQWLSLVFIKDENETEETEEDAEISEETLVLKLSSLIEVLENVNQNLQTEDSEDK